MSIAPSPKQPPPAPTAASRPSLARVEQRSNAKYGQLLMSMKEESKAATGASLSTSGSATTARAVGLLRGRNAFSNSALLGVGGVGGSVGGSGSFRQSSASALTSFGGHNNNNRNDNSHHHGNNPSNGSNSISNGSYLAGGGGDSGSVLGMKRNSTVAGLNSHLTPTCTLSALQPKTPQGAKTPVLAVKTPQAAKTPLTASKNGATPSTKATTTTPTTPGCTSAMGSNSVKGKDPDTSSRVFAKPLARALTGIESVGPKTGLLRALSSGNLAAQLQVVTHDYVGPSSPKRIKKVAPPGLGDRFIPNRTATNLTNAHIKLDMARSNGLVPARSAATSTFRRSSSVTMLGGPQPHHSHPQQQQAREPPQDAASQLYEEQVAQACGITLENRILAFSAEAPSIGDAGLRRHNSLTRSISSNSLSSSSMNLLALQKRKISKSPEKVLDAPGLVDDYYLNLLDWSSLNHLAVGLDRSVFVWNAESGQVDHLVQIEGSEMDGVASVSFSPGGDFLAVGTLQGDVQIWDVEARTKLRSMLGHLSRVGVLAWDQHVVSSGARDGSIWNHDVRERVHKVAELRGHTNEVCGLAWRADGQQLASGGNDNLVNIWDVRTVVPKFTKANHIGAVKALSWCPWQNDLLATGGGSSDRQIHFWNTTTGGRVNSIMTGAQVTSIRWNKPYREVMSSHGYPDNNLSVYSYPSLSKVHDIRAHDCRILHTAMSPDGQTVATLACDDNLKFWKLFEKRTLTKGQRAAVAGVGGKMMNGGASGGGGGSFGATFGMKRSLSRSGSFSGSVLPRDGEDDADYYGQGGMGSGGKDLGRSIASMTRLR